MKKHVVITGGATGIGRAITEFLYHQGFIPIVIDRLEPNHHDAQSLNALSCLYLQADVSHADSVAQAFATMRNHLDVNTKTTQEPHVLHALINNAGITRDGLALRMSEKDWDDVMHVNLKGTFFCCQQALKIMIKQPKSYIVSLASVVGIHGNPGQTNYAASKAGVIALTKTLAQEYASRNILVNAIAPGFISTPMTEKLSPETQTAIKERIALKRFGTTLDVAQLVYFLISGNADYITGQTIQLDGGMS